MIANYLDVAEYFSNRNMPKDVADSITSEKFDIGSQDSINGQYTLETTTKAASISASDKIIVDADVRLANSSSQFERRIKTKIVSNNEETTGLSSWINIYKNIELPISP